MHLMHDVRARGQTWGKRQQPCFSTCAILTYQDDGVDRSEAGRVGSAGCVSSSSWWVMKSGSSRHSCLGCTIKAGALPPRSSSATSWRPVWVTPCTRRPRAGRRQPDSMSTRCSVSYCDACRQVRLVSQPSRWLSRTWRSRRSYACLGVSGKSLALRYTRSMRAVLSSVTSHRHTSRPPTSSSRARSAGIRSPNFVAGQCSLALWNVVLKGCLAAGGSRWARPPGPSVSAPLTPTCQVAGCVDPRRFAHMCRDDEMVATQGRRHQGRRHQGRSVRVEA